MHSDAELISRILAGDGRAAAELVDRHKARGMTLAMRMLRNTQDAEEALQDAFVRAFRSLGKFSGASSFSTWLYRIIYNVCLDAVSKRGGRAIAIESVDARTVLEIADDDDAPDVALEAAELRAIVAEEIAMLPAHYSGMLTLFLAHDLSYDEIVEVTGVPLGTVKTQLSRARVLLRAAVARRFAVVHPDPMEVRLK